MSLPTLRALTVDAFASASPRRPIFTHFENLIAELDQRGFRCEVLCNGSFVTDAITPSDIDVVVRIDHDFSEQMTYEQAAFFDALNDDLADHVVDTFAEVAYPVGHPNFGLEAVMDLEVGLIHPS